MPRDVSGTYSLPQPAFIAGTTILSASVNSDFSDIATALTQSLATTGVSTMTGPIKAADGTVGAPGYTFGSDADTGFYRSGSGAVIFTSNGVALLELSSAGAIVDGTLGVTGNTHLIGTLTVDGTVSFGSLTASGTVAPLSVINTVNDAAEHALEVFELGSGAGAHASLRAVGTGANDVTTILLYIGATKIITYTSTLITSAVDMAIGASLTQSATGYSQYLEIAAPGAGAANTARLYSVDEATVTRLQYVDASGNLTTLYPAATQAIMETATSTTSFVTPGVQKNHPAHPKAWFLYNVVTSTLVASFGVSGVVKNATGDVTVTFSTAFSSTSYGCTGFARSNSGSGEDFVSARSTDVKTASTMQLITVGSGGSEQDCPEMFVAFWGDQ